MACNYLNNLRGILHVLPCPKNNNTINRYLSLRELYYREIIGKRGDEKGKYRKRKKAGQED